MNRPATAPATTATGALAGGLLVLMLVLSSAPGQARGLPRIPELAELLASQDRHVLTEWGLHYQHGEGVDRDMDTAIRLFCRAARKSDPLAQYYLGMLYAYGHGVARDDAMAAAWLRKAAAGGDAYARKMLHHLPEAASESRCLLSDGSEILAPLQTEPNPSQERISEWVKRLSPDYQLDPALVLAVIRTESNFNPRAHSEKGARGLMQLLPATARRFGVKDIWDPLDNIRGGMAYLRWLLEYFDGDLERSLAGYNAGEGAVDLHRGIPPYAETRHYLRRIRRELSKARPDRCQNDRGC